MTTTEPRVRPVRTTAQARRASVAWARLVDGLHAEQERAGYAGRHFGADELRHFRVALVGDPMTTPNDASGRTYWAERQEFEHSDGTVATAYAVKVWAGPGMARVDTITHGAGDDDAPRTAADALARVAFLAGVTL